MSLRDRLPSRRLVLLAAVSTALLVGAYPPFSLILPSFVALVPLLWALDELRLRNAPVAEAAWVGYWFGVFVNGVTLYWMVIALWHFTPLSALGYAASVLVVLSPQWALAAWATYRTSTRTRIPLWLGFSLIWTGVEWLQGHFGDLRFPWLGLGNSLVRLPTLVQWAEIGGARGVTLWLAWANVMVFLALSRRTWKPVVALAVTVAAAAGYGTWRERTIVMRPVTTVAVLQPNVGFNEKREERENIRLLNQLLELTRRARQDTSVRLVAWPEAAVPVYFVDHPGYADSVAELSRAIGIPILAGGLDAVFKPDGSYDNWNAAFLFEPDGRVHQRPYHKLYLVPIVERVPFINPDWFGNMKWFGGFEAGDSLPVYRIAQGSFGVLICYESTFEDLARRYRKGGADFLVNITNDAWYGRSTAPAQHASHLVMRAIETRVGIARAANSGISEFVDPLGRVHLSTPLLEERVEASPVLTTDIRTPYVRFGDWVALVAIVGSLACVAASFMHRTPQGDTT